MSVFRIVLILITCTSFTGAYAQTVAITGGKVHTVGPRGTLENATVLISDGKISAVGSGIRVPANAHTIDASGKIVTPGLFNPSGQLGLVEVSASAGPHDAAQRSAMFTASFDIADAYNSRSTLVAINRIEGVTRAAVMPMAGGLDDFGAHGHVLSGLGAIVNLGDRNGLDKRAAAMVVNLGEGGSDYAGGSRAGAWLQLRNALGEAIDYRDNALDVERGMRRTYAHSIADLKALQAVLDGDTPLLVNIDRASDIEVLIALVNEYELRAIISGGSEAWTLAEELAAADIAIILDVTRNLPGNFDQLNVRRGAANTLMAAGVNVALSDGQSRTHNARNITQSAGNAVADGMQWDAALRAITLAPAQMYGVAEAVGSIEVGKLADIVIWPADPFELSTYADQVIINGEIIPMQSRQTLLRDRYLQNESKKPPAYRD